MICKTPVGQSNEQKAGDLLIYYFNMAGIPVERDFNYEVRSVVEHIIEAVLAEVRPDIQAASRHARESP